MTTTPPIPGLTRENTGYTYPLCSIGKARNHAEICYNWDNLNEWKGAALTAPSVAPKGLVSMQDHSTPTTTEDTTEEVPYGYCHCGCGEKTRLSRVTSADKGWVRGEPLKYIRGHFGRRHDLVPPNPSGLCMCGCGGKAPIAPNSSAKYGYVRGEPMRYIVGHAGRPKLPVSERFWGKVKRTTGCWEWQGTIGSDGYGRFNAREVSLTSIRAHRMAYELSHGPIPKGLLVCHKCDNPVCCNPDHLFAGTPKDNMRDKVRKNRHRPEAVAGERSPSAKLTWSEVADIRRLRREGRTQKDLAEQYGVSITAIAKIEHFKTWRLVELGGGKP